MRNWVAPSIATFRLGFITLKSRVMVRTSISRQMSLSFPGQDAYVKIESLSSWSTFVGAGYVAARDTFYARLMLPQIARSEIVQSFFDGGS